MKKDDVIQRRQDVPKDKCLMHGFVSLEKADYAKKNVHEHYNLPEGVALRAGGDDLNPGKFAVIADEDTYIISEAKVNWVVDQEVGITYTDSGGSAIIDLTEETDWVVIKSAAPTYQSDVEHMSDEDLRASIDTLRGQRVARPPSARAKKKEPAMSAQDKALLKLLENKTPEEKLDLKRKLGMID